MYKDLQLCFEIVNLVDYFEFLRLYNASVHILLGLNTRFCCRIVQELLDLSPEDLASDEKRQLNYKIRQEAAAEAVRGISQAASTDMFK